MEYTTLGETGMEVSRLCLGCAGFGISDDRDWGLGRDESVEIIERAIDLGVNFFDTANTYADGESEQVLGQAIEGHRERSVVASKIHPSNAPREGPNVSGRLSRKAIEQEVEKSRNRLGVDTIDLYQLHRWDYATPVAQTLRAFADLVRRGVIRHGGASAMHAHQFFELAYESRQTGYEPFVTMQNHYNLLYREEEREMLPFCEKNGIGVMPFSPLARGTLTRPHDQIAATERGESDDLLQERLNIYLSSSGKEINERVQELADEKGATMAQISLAWLLHKEWVDAPVIGVTSVEHLEDSIEALDISLSESEMDYLEEPYEPRPVTGLFRYNSEWKEEHGLVEPSGQQ